MQTPYYCDDSITLHHGDALEVLRQIPAASVDCCVTSPPYFGLRDYGDPKQYGMEATPADYVERLCDLFGEIHRVLVDDGTVWLNIGDSYAAKARGSDAGWARSRLNNPGRLQKSQAAALRRTGERHRGKAAGISEKNLLGIPWRTAFALQDDGWTLRNAVIWHKPNGMPESVKDRLRASYEHVFLLTKSAHYWFDLEAIKEPTQGRASGNLNGAEYAAAVGRGRVADRHGGNAGSTLHTGVPASRNPGDVWSVPTSPFAEAHFAAMPPALAERCVRAGCRPGGVVLDPCSGSGTTGLAAIRNGRRYVGIDLNRDYLDLSLRTRLAQSYLRYDEEEVCS